MTWPHLSEQESIYRWRGLILFSIIFVGLILGIFAFVAAGALVLKENAWGLAIVDTVAVPVGLVLLLSRRIKFETRAYITCMAFYCIGMAVILSVGILSGGPAWLFTFAVLAGVLLGNRAASFAIALNAVSLIVVGLLVSNGRIGDQFPFFNTPQAAVAAGVNFLFLNAVTAVSVSALLKGLTTSEKRYRLIADNVADVIWTMDMDLNFTYISPSIYQMQGYTPDEFIKKEIDKIVTPESLQQVLNLYETTLSKIRNGDEKGWQPVTFEAEEYHKNGQKLWVSINASILQGTDGRPEGILGVSRDITGQKKSEQEKINAQLIAEENKKLALVGQIAGKMAHDFNNVLGIIMAQSELALLTCSDLEVRKVFNLLLEQTIRGKNLTRNLIAFANRAAPKKEFFPLKAKIDFVLNLLSDELKNIKIVKNVPGSIEILADPGMMEHTLVNLIQNSIHALSLKTAPFIRIYSDIRDKKIVLEIEDNGCGIPPEYIEEVFDPSFTLKGSKDEKGLYQTGIKGTGYGLANVKKYIAQHNGKISIFSKPGSGAKVTISLPFVQKELPHEEKTGFNSVKKCSGKKILIVEDEEAIAQAQKSILSNAPFRHQVDIASSGEEAIELFEQKSYDMISLDYILPGKMNGKEIYTHIRKKNASIPVLFLSGNIEFIESVESLKKRDPNIDHLSKPCRNVEYLESLNRLMEKTIDIP